MRLFSRERERDQLRRQHAPEAVREPAEATIRKDAEPGEAGASIAASTRMSDPSPATPPAPVEVAAAGQRIKDVAPRLDGGQAEHTIEALTRRAFEHDLVPLKGLIGTGKSLIAFAELAPLAVLDFAAERADAALRDWTASLLDVPLDEVARRVIFVLSGGCPGVITPHVAAITSSDRHTPDAISSRPWRPRPE